MPFDAYEVYCTHCRARGEPCPTREWWDAACHGVVRVVQFEPDFDIETEKREGWGYDNSL
jgi:hypothetical protein